MRRSVSVIQLTIVCFIAQFSIATSFVFAQEKLEQATREAERKAPQAEPKRRVPKETAQPQVKEEAPPAPVSGKRTMVRHITLAGCYVLPPEHFSGIVAAYENRELSLVDLKQLARQIEEEYFKQGFIGVVLIPPQDIRDQSVTLQVVEAKMGTLIIKEHKYFKASRLKRYWKIAPGEAIRYSLISEALQKMNRNPDREVKSSLVRGKESGTTDVVLEAKTRLPVHVTSYFDRDGSRYTGKDRLSVGMQHNNCLGFDDTLLFGYKYGSDFSGKYIYHNLPIGFDGVSLFYGYSQGKAIPKEEFAPFGVIADSQDTTLSLHKDLYHDGTYRGEMFVGFDAKDKTIRQDSGVSNRDRLRIFSLGRSLVFYNPSDSSYLSFKFFQGVSAFGGSERGDPLFSRGANPQFSKFDLMFIRRQLLPFDMQANIRAETQVSSTKLPSAETFGLGGMDSVRGYPAYDYLADQAVILSGELLLPPFPSVDLSSPSRPGRTNPVTVTPLLFIDYGWGMRRNEIGGERPDVTYLSVGPGLRIRLFDKALLRLEWGFPLADDPITSNANSQFHFSVDFQI